MGLIEIYSPPRIWRMPPSDLMACGGRVVMYTQMRGTLPHARAHTWYTPPLMTHISIKLIDRSTLAIMLQAWGEASCRPGNKGSGGATKECAI